MGAYENVFGEGVQFDDNGDPIETGIGAEAHPDQVALRERLARQTQDKALPLIAAAAVEAPAQEAAASQPAPDGATSAATPVEAAATAPVETGAHEIEAEAETL